MNTLGRLEKMMLKGHITIEEYQKRKAKYVEVILELYCLDLITEEEMRERLNK